MSEDLRVGFAHAFNASLEEAFSELLIVLNDAVVHKVDGSRLGGMRVGVDLRHTTMGGPAGVRNAKRTLNARWQDGLQIGHFADGFVRLDGFTVVDRHTG